MKTTKTVWYCRDCQKMSDDQRYKKCPYCGGLNSEAEDGRLWDFVQGTDLEGRPTKEQIAAYNK